MKNRFERQAQYHSIKKVKGKCEWLHQHFTEDGSSLGEIRRKSSKKTSGNQDHLERRITGLEAALEETNDALKLTTDLLNHLMINVRLDSLRSSFDPSSLSSNTHDFSAGVNSASDDGAEYSGENLSPKKKRARSDGVDCFDSALATMRAALREDGSSELHSRPSDCVSNLCDPRGSARYSSLLRRYRLPWKGRHQIL